MSYCNKLVLSEHCTLVEDFHVISAVLLVNQMLTYEDTKSVCMVSASFHVIRVIKSLQSGPTCEST